MPTLVSRNTIKLSSGSSAVTDYYKGYTIVLSRYNTITGKQLIQRKEVISYNGTSKIATIDGIWDEDFIPGPGDTYKIVPTYADSRVSTNPAIQTLDYISSERYGKGLNPLTDLYMPSWTYAARLCDTQSDVTIKTATTLTGIAVSAVYRLTSGSVIIWQGNVKSWKTGYVTFNEVFGKLANKWNSWKSYIVGDLVYDEDRLYQVTVAGTKTTKPVHTSGTTNGLARLTSIDVTKFSGSGPTTLALIVNGNPVQDINTAGNVISGYSLYDADGVDYWRYLGWDEHSQRFATRHQTNLIIDTSAPVFENINSLLEHFGGILRYTAGQYHLEIETGEGTISSLSTEPRTITNESHIIGKIRISDEGIRNSFNSLTIAYADPANKFEAKNISFFNSDFLKADRNVSKKGNMSIPGITNYYNARLLADKFLIKSRYGLTISFNMAPRGLLLLAGRVIQIDHPRYGWTNKKFRITNITHNTDTTVDIVAKEYDDSMYIINSVTRPPSVALAGETNTRTNILPGGLTATSISSSDEIVGGIELEWTNSPGADSTVATELFGSSNAWLFVTAESVSGGSVFTTSTLHGLTVGDSVISQESTNGLIFNKTYYVKTTPDLSSFTLSETPAGSAITTFTNGSGLALKLITATIIATVEPPANSYIDVIPGDGIERIQKHYWIRHRITKR